MQANDIILKQFEYNYWANGRVFEKVALVSAEDFNAQTVVENRSLQQVLAHMVRVERIWRLLARDGKLNPQDLPSEGELVIVDDIVDFAVGEEQEMRAYLANLSPEDLAEEMVITRWDGVQVTMTRWHMLVHLAMHSMQHRSEASVLLTQYGQSPGDLDFLFFVL
ncbi:MAG: DinB family protein [Candidatus Promineifilaceae bacterium]|nr:DinB family protein [Candidatus Promineifilaceae bacterium]